MKNFKSSLPLSASLAFIGAMTLAIESTAHAEGPFLIKDQTGPQPLLDAFGPLATELTDQINNSIFSTENQAVFADGMAGANASGNSSMIADRAGDPMLASVSAGIQANLFGVSSLSNLDLSTSNSLPSMGFGLHSALTVGVKANRIGLGKLGPIDGSRLTLNFSYLSYDADFGAAAAQLSSYGFNLKYKLAQPIGLSFLAKWGGVDFLTGVNYVSNKATYSGSLSQSSTDDLGNTLTATFDYDLGVQSKVFYVPLEVSTSVQILYLFTAYGGAGVDLNFGSAGLIGGGTGDLSAANNNVPQAGYAATAVLDFDTYGYKAKPSLLNPRGFIGGQFNLSILKVGVESTFSTSGNMGLAFYGRLSF